MNPRKEHALQQTRRHFFGQSAAGIGTAALASLLKPELFAAKPAGGDRRDGVLKKLHFAPKAKRIIYLFMSGAPSQIDLLDYKPQLNKHFTPNCPIRFVRDSV